MYIYILYSTHVISTYEHHLIAVRSLSTTSDHSKALKAFHFISLVSRADPISISTSTSSLWRTCCYGSFFWKQLLQRQPHCGSFAHFNWDFRPGLWDTRWQDWVINGLICQYSRGIFRGVFHCWRWAAWCRATVKDCRLLSSLQCHHSSNSRLLLFGKFLEMHILRCWIFVQHLPFSNRGHINRSF